MQTLEVSRSIYSKKPGTHAFSGMALCQGSLRSHQDRDTMTHFHSLPMLIFPNMTGRLTQIRHASARIEIASKPSWKPRKIAFKTHNLHTHILHTSSVCAHHQVHGQSSRQRSIAHRDRCSVIRKHPPSCAPAGLLGGASMGSASSLRRERMAAARW